MRAQPLLAPLALAAALASCAGARPDAGADAGADAATALAAQEPPAPAARPATDRPAPGPYPAPPDIERPDDERPPAPARLARDGAVVGRLRDEGWSARLDFEADAGELSLFELTSWGYARGWTSRAGLVVRDASGAELARSERDGGTVYQDVLPFVAPRDGTYALELTAVESGFRYLVVRHSGYASGPGEEVLDVGPGTLAHSWLDGPTDATTLRIDAPAGALVLVRAEPTTERGRNQKRNLRRRMATAVAGLVDARRMAEGLDPRARDDGSFPDLAVTVRGAEVVGGRGHVVVVRAPEGGAFDLSVRATNEGPPGLFDVTVERELDFAPLVVRVGDEEDDPVPGARIALLLEPALDPIAAATTGADGEARVVVPPGDYTVVLRGPTGAPSVVRARVVPGEPLNLVAGSAAGRGR